MTCRLRYDRTTRPSRPRTPPSAGCVTAAASASTSECAALDHPLTHTLSFAPTHSPTHVLVFRPTLILAVFVFVVVVVERERDVSLLLLLRLLLRHLLIFILLLLVSLLPPLPLPLLPLLVLLLPGSYGSSLRWSSPSYDTTLSPTTHRRSRPAACSLLHDRYILNPPTYRRGALTPNRIHRSNIRLFCVALLFLIE